MISDAIPYTSSELEAFLTPCVYMEPVTHEHASEYLQLEFEEDGLTYRFKPHFIRQFVTLHPDDLNLHGLRAQPYEIRNLIEKLGLALVRNKDVPRATRIAEIKDDVILYSSEYYLGAWHYDQGLYEESVPFLESALKSNLQRNSYPTANAIADMLENTFRQLGPRDSWNQIYGRIASSQPLQTYFSDLIRLEGTSIQPPNYKFNEKLPLLQLLQPRLRSLFRHILTSLELAEVYQNLAELMSHRASCCSICRGSGIVCGSCGARLKDSIEHLDELVIDPGVTSNLDALTIFKAAREQLRLCLPHS